MKILTVEQIKAAEQDAVLSGIFSFSQLMENAAKKSFDYIMENIVDGDKTVCVVCGKGNNGGDGLCIAHLLKSAGLDVSLFFPLGRPASNPATEFISYCDEMKNLYAVPSKCDILIDALFGIGFSGELDRDMFEVISRMNMCDAKKVAIDIPSGVYASGRGFSAAFFADTTLTFIALKPCFFLPPFNSNCGKVEVLDIGVVPREYAYKTIDKAAYHQRNKNAHKGTFGTMVNISGSYGMCGAEILSSRAALVSGVGILKAFVCDKNYSAFTSSVPEAVVVPTETFASGAPAVYDAQIKTALSFADSLLIGCGLGATAEAEGLVKAVLEQTNVPTVIDADGINALAKNIELLGRIKAPVVITPHPGEMARLCKTHINDIEENRIEYAKRTATVYGIVVVLKGANTIVAAPDGSVYFNTTGNAGMATGGSGDVLAGMIGARLALGESSIEAAKNAVWLHGYAADSALKKYSMDGLLPSDIISELKTIKY